MRTRLTFRLHLLSMRFWRWLETKAQRRFAAAQVSALWNKQTLDRRAMLAEITRK